MAKTITIRLGDVQEIQLEQICKFRGLTYNGEVAWLISEDWRNLFGSANSLTDYANDSFVVEERSD